MLSSSIQLRFLLTLILTLLIGCDNYDEGYKNGYQEGYKTGKKDGYQEGYNEGYLNGERNGYLKGTLAFTWDHVPKTAGQAIVIFLLCVSLYFIYKHSKVFILEYIKPRIAEFRIKRRVTEINNHIKKASEIIIVSEDEQTQKNYIDKIENLTREKERLGKKIVDELKEDLEKLIQSE